MGWGLFGVRLGARGSHIASGLQGALALGPTCIDTGFMSSPNGTDFG